MARKQTNKLWPTMIALLGAIMALVMIPASTYAQCYEIILPDGTVLRCEAQNGTKVYVDDNGNVYNLTSTGIGDFEIVSTNGETCIARLKPLSIVINSTDPTLGTVTTTLDPTRTPTLSQISANAPGTLFPATEDLYFFAEASVSSKPGVTYRSLGEIHLQATVNSFNPHNNEVFSSTGPVSFEDPANPGVAAFTLNNISITLGGQPQATNVITAITNVSPTAFPFTVTHIYNGGSFTAAYATNGTSTLTLPTGVSNYQSAIISGNSLLPGGQLSVTEGGCVINWSLLLQNGQINLIGQGVVPPTIQTEVIGFEAGNPPYVVEYNYESGIQHVAYDTDGIHETEALQNAGALRGITVDGEFVPVGSVDHALASPGPGWRLKEVTIEINFLIFKVTLKFGRG